MQTRGAGVHLPREEETNFCFGRIQTHAHDQQAPVLSLSDKTAWADLEVFHFYPLPCYKSHNLSFQTLRSFSNLFSLVILERKIIWMSKSLTFQPLFLTPWNNFNISECSTRTEYSSWCFCHLWISCTIFPSLKLVNPELPSSQCF